MLHLKVTEFSLDKWNHKNWRPEELKTVAPPTEYDALAEELLAIQDYVKEL